MSFFVLKSTSGLRKEAALEYCALNDDPAFVYRFWSRRPRYMVVFLQALNEPLNPKVYVDGGKGFDETNAISLPPAGSCIYSIRIELIQPVTKIRIDPCEFEGRFRYWAKVAWNEAEISEVLVEAQRRAQGAASICDIVVRDVFRGHAKHRRPASSVSDHFSSIVRLAEKTAPPMDKLLDGSPFISFVTPVYDTSRRYLDDLLASFLRQPAGSAELILCDDGSTLPQTVSWLKDHEGMRDVRVIRNSRNLGIAHATNSGIWAAKGEWIGFIDHDDVLVPCAVQLIAQTARENPRCLFIYTDEIVTDRKLKPVSYLLKPAYDEVLLSGVNYINHLSCYRRDRLLERSGMRAGFDGSQDYDLLLRYLRGLRAEEIKHLPYPAYMWRRSDSAFSVRFMKDANKRARMALSERYSRGGDKPPVEAALLGILHRVRFDKVATRWPRVSVVIPSRDSFSLISRVIEDLTCRTDYPELEIIVVDNGSTDPRVLELYSNSKSGAIPFTLDFEPAPFNFSRQVNRGIALATGEVVLLLNNDVEVIEGDWLREMVSCLSYPDTGIVGARLLYPSRRLQHAGVIVGLGGLAAHWFSGKKESFPGPMGRLHVRQSFTAVTGACMLISRACLKTVGSFDEKEFAIAYNDIDFCLRAAARGFRVVWTPFATLIHQESASRGSDEAPANRDRFDRDKDSLRKRYSTHSFEDRAFSPWYTRDRAEPALMMLDRLPGAR